MSPRTFRQLLQGAVGRAYLIGFSEPKTESGATGRVGGMYNE